MGTRKFNLTHAVFISLLLHGLLFITADKGWIRLPGRPVPLPEPEPIRFTLVETEPSEEETKKEDAVLSDADRIASSPDPVPVEDDKIGTDGVVQQVNLAPPVPPEQREPPRPPPVEPQRPVREEQETEVDRQEPEEMVLEDMNESETDSENRRSILESMYMQRPPENIIPRDKTPSPQLKGGRAGRFGPVQFDSTDFDFGPYARRMVEIVRKNWYSIMPWSAKWGTQGKVRLRFVIRKNGTIKDLQVLSSSESSPLDRAALGSITLSNPFMPLPSEFKEDEVGVTFSYYYNIPVDGE